MPLSRIITADGSITESKLAANAVTQSKLAADAAQTPQIADANVITSKIADSNIVSSKIADANIVSSKLASNLSLEGKTVFGAAIQEKSNVISSNIGPTIIDIDPLNNSILFYTSNTHDNTAHTVNFLNLQDVEVGNTVSFVVAVTNNTDSFANISNVRIMGNEARGHERTATSNNLFVSGSLPITGSANVDIYSFNIQKVQTSSYTVFLSKTNFS